ncbi:hypothetical protein EV421DRAFT_1971308 [Armillaria borealis]|uniref:Uncharacterized protein n=1 Tax=Armillaria borealis TaxID=47425 RepID=A0AA39M5K6_9AGAR|nr:hypothetical protein EV421DRAFT_1971308 [Armillaria borealis]
MASPLQESQIPNLPGSSQLSQSNIGLLKRRIAELEEEVVALKGTPQARHQESFKQMGRVLPRVMSPFDSVRSVVDEKIRRQQIEEDSSSEDGESVLPTLEQERLFRGYQAMVESLGPRIERSLLGSETTAGEFNNICTLLSNGASAARTADTHCLMVKVPEWINRSIKLADMQEELLDTETRIGRGFDHYITGAYLCPIEYDWSDPNVRAALQNGDPQYPVTAESWPRFLFPDPELEHNDSDEGFAQSPLLQKAWKCLMTSPRSAEEIDLNTPASRVKRQKRNPLRCVANIVGLKSVTARSIAYVAVQAGFFDVLSRLRIALTQSGWQQVDGDFDYHIFFNNIVDYFEDAPGPIAEAKVKAVLEWWTNSVFKTGKTRLSQSLPNGGSVKRLAAKRDEQERGEHTV